MTDKPQTELPAPVLPSRMEISFQYQCPFCGVGVRILRPIQPVLVNCPACSGTFPIAPVNESDLNFFRIMTADGKACVQIDYL